MKYAAILGLMLLGCGNDAVAPTPLPSNTTVDNRFTITVINGQPPASPDPTASPLACPTVSHCGISADLEGRVIEWTTHDTPRLDLTPKDRENNPVPTSCHAPTVAWVLSGNPTCRLTSEQTGFNPYVGCSGAGDLLVTGATSGVTCQSRFTVR